MLKIALSLIMKLLTEKFLSKTAVHLLASLAKSTANELDDQIVSNVAEALAIPLPGKPNP
jgi:hypothetical protein